MKLSLSAERAGIAERQHGRCRLCLDPRGPLRSHRLPLRAALQQQHGQPAPSSSITGTAAGPPPRPPPPPLSRAGALSDRLLWDYAAGWAPLYQEYDYYVPAEAVYGTLPKEIRGTLFLIGPALTQAYGTAVRHPSDADGMVCSLAFGDGGQIFFRNRYVRTPTFVAEQSLGRRLTRGRHDRGAPPVPPEGPHSPHSPSSSGSSREQPLVTAAANLLSGISTTIGTAVSTVTAGAGAVPGGGSVGRAARNDDGGWDRPAGEEEAEAERRAARERGNGGGGGAPTGWRLDPMSLLGLPPLPPPSSLFNPTDTSFRAPANANVVFWAGRLLAFCEGGALPYELHKLSLETVGPYDMAGAFSDMGQLVGGYKIVPAPPAPHAHQQQGQEQGQQGPGARKQRLVVMGAAQSGPDVLLRWAEVDEAGALAAPPTTYRLPGAAVQSVYDFWVTDGQYVVVQAPLDFNPEQFVTRSAVGAASFAECFDWDAGRPSVVHLVPRPQPQPPKPPAPPKQHVPGGSKGVRSDTAGLGGSQAGAAPPPPPPQAAAPAPMAFEAPPLLPTRCVGCYEVEGGRVLVLDAMCQQGGFGSVGGGLDFLDPLEHRRQPKPELVRLVLDRATGTCRARVLSQRTAHAAATAGATTAAAAEAAALSAAAAGPVGAGAGAAAAASSRAWGSDAYGHVFVTAGEADAAEGWAPPQVLVKLHVPHDYGLALIQQRQQRQQQQQQQASTSTAAAGTQRTAASTRPPPSGPASFATVASLVTAAITGAPELPPPPAFLLPSGTAPIHTPAGPAPSSPRALPEPSSSSSAAASHAPLGVSPLSRGRGLGSEVWAPGDRVFLGPPTFVPKATSVVQSRSTVPSKAQPSDGGPESASAAPSPLPPLQTEVEEAAQSAAAAARAARTAAEQDGWLLVPLYDADSGRAELCILDAAHVSDGPVAVVALPHHVPHVRAAHFTASYCGPGQAAPPGWRPRAAAAPPA